MCLCLALLRSALSLRAMLTQAAPECEGTVQNSSPSSSLTKLCGHPGALFWKFSITPKMSLTPLSYHYSQPLPPSP